MTTENITNTLNMQNITNLTNLVFDFGFILFFAMYFIFSLIVIRQVGLMTDTVITEGRIYLKTLSYLHALVALVILIAYVGIVFNIVR